MPAALISAIVRFAAPLVTIEAWTGETTGMSLARIDRIGPTLVGMSEWEKAARRGRPPSTSSSTTMSALLRPTCGWLETVLSIFATSTGWLSAQVLLDGTCRPVSGQNWVIVWPPSTFCGSAAGVELDEPPQALSSRLVAVRADR